MRYLLSLVILVFSFGNLQAQPQSNETLASLFSWRDATNKRLENMEKKPAPDNSAMISALQAQIAQLNQQIFTMQQLQIQQLQRQIGPAIPLNPNPGPVIPLNPNPGPIIPLIPPQQLQPPPPINPNPGPGIPGPGAGFQRLSKTITIDLPPRIIGTYDTPPKIIQSRSK